MSRRACPVQPDGAADGCVDEVDAARPGTRRLLAVELRRRERVRPIAWRRMRRLVLRN